MCLCCIIYFTKFIVFALFFSVNLHRHLQAHGVDYLQFSFRWMNNLLTRELPLHCTIRLWDTYLAESDGFALFHLYVCAAFLLHWKEQLMQQTDFQVCLFSTDLKTLVYIMTKFLEFISYGLMSMFLSAFIRFSYTTVVFYFFRVSCCCYKICQPTIGPIAK